VSDIPVLWSFRRCPYAIRARLAIASARIPVRLQEILLRDKPAAFLAASASGTVPCLQGENVIDESRDIMLWALEQRDPDQWLARLDVDTVLIDQNDGPFKTALDHTKYAVRFPDLSMESEREKAAKILRGLNDRLSHMANLTGDTPSLADAAILPFVRQFANVDRAWFDAQGWPHLMAWLDAFLASDSFARVMHKYPPWQEGQDAVIFAHPD